MTATGTREVSGPSGDGPPDGHEVAAAGGTGPSRPADRARVVARRGAPYLVLAVVLVAVGLLAADPGVDGAPLDPASTAPDGTKALVDTLRELGAEVDVTDAAPDADVDTVLLLLDDLDDDGRDALERWPEGGGTLVVADPSSPLTPEVVGTTSIGLVDSSIARGCEEPSLVRVGRVSAPGGAVYEVPDGAQGCYPRGEGHWLVVESRGEGALVALGGQGVLVNAGLGEADNAVLLASLLVPVDGARVHVQLPPLPGDGDAALGDLVPERVTRALLQLAGAFVVVALWRARRLGRPVTEPRPVEVPGSELTVAVGGLLQRTGARAQAATVLRDDLRRTLAERYGLPPSTPSATVVDAVAVRAGVDRQALLDALEGPPPADDAALLDLAGAVDRVRSAALSPAGDRTHPDGPDPTRSPTP